MKTLLVASIFYFLLSFDALSSEQTLINGEVVDQKDYPYVVKIRSGNASCTATVVGKRVVLTAAHCVRSGGTVTFKTTAGGSFSGKAVRSPIYPRKDHDIAVVILSEDVDVPAAHISKQSLKVGDSLFLMGFGCTRPRGGGTDGKLRAGSAEVKRFNGYDAVSSSGAALCFGDSGGPGFVEDPRGGHPVITTVNSKGDIRTTNYTAMLATSASKEFLELMAKNHDAEICGLTSDCEKEPDPEPEPEPEPDPGPEPEPGCDSEKQAFIIKEVRQCLKL